MAQLRVPITSLDHILGDHNAIVTLVEYGDYECPHCAAAQPILAQILVHFGNRLRLIYRHFPMVEVHPHAGAACSRTLLADAPGHLRPPTPIERGASYLTCCEPQAFANRSA